MRIRALLVVCPVVASSLIALAATASGVKAMAIFLVPAGVGTQHSEPGAVVDGGELVELAPGDRTVNNRRQF